MTTLKNLKGTAIQFLDADPVVNAGSWASGGDTNKSGQGRGAAGTQTSNLIFGGDAPTTAYVEEYNGTSWTETTDMNSGKIYGFGCGTNAESAMSCGGYTNPSGPWFTLTETWNGSSWTEVNEMNTARGDGGMFGVVPGSIAAGGYSGSLNPAVESWNGSSWSEVAELNTARYYGCGIGHTGTAGLIVAGSTPPNTTANELWNGSSWTEVGDLNTARNRAGGSGTSTLGLAYGGAPNPGLANTESWNGSSWTEVADLSTARYGLASSPFGTSQSALASGGYTTTQVSSTEEWSFPPATASALQEGDMWFNSTSSTLKGYGLSIATGTWASGGSLNQAKGRVGFASNATSTTHVALVFGGNTPSKTVNTEEYNGTSWTEKSNINTARSGYGGGGTLTSAIYAGGESPSNPYNYAIVELYDGSSWSETTDLNTARRSNVGFGVSNTDAMTASGYVTAASALTEIWNGSAWTEVADQNAAKYARGGTGTTTNGILFGGTDPTTNTETWNGTAWTEVSELNTKGEYRAASGTATQVLATGGYPATANTELWNGSSWTEINNISTARWEGGGTGSASFGMISGGNTPPITAATEEFTADNAVLTVTTSQLTF